MRFSSSSRKPLLHNYKTLNDMAKVAFRHIQQTTIENKRQLKIFGIIFLINYPLYYLIWANGSHQHYENIYLRISASLLCVPLIFHDRWPMNLRKYLPLYWHFTAMYCLPFVFTFMTIKNNASTAWLLNLILALLLIFLLFDFITLCILTVIGFSLASIGCFIITTTHFNLCQVISIFQVLWQRF